LVGVDGSAAAKPHVSAEVVSILETKVAFPTHDAALDGYSLSWSKVGNVWANLSDNAGCFVAQHERRPNCKIAILAVFVVMEITTAETSCDDSELA
jgi:hypothetical protein